ncbi:MAG TPA: hypothetical protein ENN87_11650 [Phycisphaerales bacterium]|nr:hypothetical protein [Phycisphaerales bacterium]
MEIVAAHYDRHAGTWTSHPLTSNAHLDRTPRLAAAGDGTAVAVWVYNEQDDILGLNSDALNTLCYSRWDGAAWTAPGTAATNVGLIVKTALACKQGQAAYLYTVDMDHDWQTDTDREVYVLLYDGGGWSAPYRLTDDDLIDANPQVVYDGNDLLVVWYRDGNLVSVRNFDPDTYQEVLQTSGSSTSMDFRLALSPSGQISLVWTEASPQGVDIFTATYDNRFSVWSKPYQLTADRAMERSISATYAGTDELALAYNKVDIINVGGVPEPNRVDLYVLRHSISTDLAVWPEGIVPGVPNPMPGSTVTIDATIYNLGDVAEANVPVAFYNGDPDDGGVLIDMVQILAGPIAAGDYRTATVSWVVPEANDPQRIFVLVDPNGERQDRDWMNNIASISVMAPDLTVTGVISQRIGPKKRAISARVANIGTLPAQDFEVAFNRDSDAGVQLASFNIPKLDPGVFQDVWHVWNIAAEDLDGIEATVHVTVDRPNTVLEADEHNNSAVELVQVGKAADTTDNGIVDFWDWMGLANAWLDDCTGPEWCDGHDFDRSGRVDFKDVARMAEQWLWQASWRQE